jgi:hypothetical protein
MSRKRERQRETQRELARQLGVGVDDVPDAVRDHARVSEPELQVALASVTAKRGLFSRAQPLSLHVVVYVVDNSGVRVAHRTQLRAQSAGVPLTLVESGGPARLRYARPARFVVVTAIAEGASEAENATVSRALEAADVSLARAEGGAFALDDAAFARSEAAVAVAVVHAGAPLFGEARFRAAMAVALPAVHRVHEERTFALASFDGAFRADVVVSLRL